MKIVDNRGLSCPQPVINTKRALDAMGVGTLVSIVDNVVARENVLKFARSQGCTTEVREDKGIFSVVITRGGTAPTSEPQGLTFTSEQQPSLYLVMSDEFGRGSSELANALMKTFFYALSESEAQGNHLVLVNSGVKLACVGSPVLERLQTLLAKGWDIKACGTCLDFFGLKEQLTIGEITNMYTIVELMNAAGKVISL